MPTASTRRRRSSSAAAARAEPHPARARAPVTGRRCWSGWRASRTAPISRRTSLSTARRHCRRPGDSGVGRTLRADDRGVGSDRRGGASLPSATKLRLVRSARGRSDARGQCHGGRAGQRQGQGAVVVRPASRARRRRDGCHARWVPAGSWCAWRPTSTRWPSAGDALWRERTGTALAPVAVEVARPTGALCRRRGVGLGILVGRRDPARRAWRPRQEQASVASARGASSGPQCRDAGAHGSDRQVRARRRSERRAVDARAARRW